jgi:hypothetical protein
MSIGMAVPVRPRNWDSAEVRRVRAVRASRGVVDEVLGWLILDRREVVSIGRIVAEGQQGLQLELEIGPWRIAGGELDGFLRGFRCCVSLVGWGFGW